jgi:hypothetical protein
MRITALLIAASLATAAYSHGQVIMVNFGTSTIPGGETNNSPYHSVESSFTDTTWNQAGNSDQSSLLYSDGTAATGISLDLGRGPGGVVDFTDNSNYTGTLTNAGIGGIYSLTTMESAIWGSNSSTNDYWMGLKIDGLSSGTYEVYAWGNNGNTSLGDTPMALYGTSGASSNSYNFSSLTANAISNNNSTAWTDGVSYQTVSITISSGESLYLAIDGTSTQTRGFLSGIQLVTVPEPSSFALIAGLLGLSGAAFRRRR